MKVFLSSTSKDLQAYRDVAYKVCVDLGLVAIGMEFFESMSQGATEGSKRKVKESDVYVGIFAHRYGYVEDGYDYSVTEIEFDFAGELQIDRLCFVMDEAHPWPPNLIEFEARDKLQALKDKVQKLVCNFFREEIDLYNKLYRTLNTYKGKTVSVATAVVPHQLPPAPAQFIGRAALLEEMKAQVEAGTTIIGVRGLPGIGKTAVALKLAHALSARYPDGQVYMDLKGADARPLSATEAMRHAIRSFQAEATAPAGDKTALAGLYQSVLYDKRVLLLLDNVSDATQARVLLPPASCLLLMTSEMKTALPDLQYYDLEELPLEDAVAMLTNICARSAQEAEAIAEHCGRIPLALVLAGVALAERPDLSVVDHLRQLHEGDRLTELDRAAGDGRGFAASLRFSESSLPEPVRRLFRQLAVFAGGFELVDAKAIWNIDERRAHETIGTLLRHFLVDWKPNEQVYRLKELVADYARAQLTTTELRAAKRNHARYFLTVTEEADYLYKQGSDDQARSLQLFDKKWRNIEAGFNWACTHATDTSEARERYRASPLKVLYHLLARTNATADPDARILCCAYPLKALYYLWARQPATLHKQWFSTALKAARALRDRKSEVRALNFLGTAHRDMGEQEEALKCFDEALKLARELGSRHEEANILGNLGVAYVNAGQTQQGIEHYEQVLAIADAVGDAKIKANAMHALGLAYNNLQQWDKATEYYSQQLNLARQSRDLQNEAKALLSLSSVCNAQEQYTQSIALLNQHLPIVQRIGDRDGEAQALDNLKVAYVKRGQVQQGLEALHKYLTAVRAANDRVSEVIVLGVLGLTHTDTGQPRQAIPYFEQQLTLAHALYDRAGKARALAYLGIAYSASGDCQQAIAYYEQNLHIVRELNDQQSEMYTLGGLGIVYSNAGELERVVELSEKQLAVARRLSDRANEAVALNNLAFAYNGLGEAHKAIPLLERQRELAKEIGDRAQEANAAGTLGLAFSALGQPHQAVVHIEEQLQIARELGDKYTEAVGLDCLANEYAALGQTARALELLECSLAIACELKNPLLEATVTGYTGVAYFAAAELDKAIAYFEQYLDYCQKVNNRLWTCDALTCLGEIYAEKEGFALARDYLERSKEIATTLKNRRCEGNIARSLGLTLAGLGELAEGEKFCRWALELMRELNDRRGVAHAHWNLGKVYTWQGKLATAREHLQQRVDYEREIGHALVEQHAAEMVTILVPKID